MDCQFSNWMSSSQFQIHVISSERRYPSLGDMSNAEDADQTVRKFRHVTALSPLQFTRSTTLPHGVAGSAWFTLPVGGPAVESRASQRF